MDKSNCKKDQFSYDNGMCCIDTYRIFDSGKSRDCIENNRVYFSAKDQETLNSSLSVRARSSRILWTRIDSSPTPFSNGYYNINVKYFFLINIDCCLGGGMTQEIHGLAMFQKNALLYGGEINVSSFTSEISPSFCPDMECNLTPPSNLPRVVIEAADPVILKVEAFQGQCERFCQEPINTPFPDGVTKLFDGDLITQADPLNKVLYISLGLFSVIRLERPTQLVVPACDVCVPPSCPKPSECPSDPCSLFREMDFPIKDFYPCPTPEVKDECNCKEKVYDPQDFG